MKMKIALFHPWLKSRGGAERVVLEFLKHTKHDVDVYSWVYDKANTFKEFGKFKIKVIAPKIAQLFARSYILRGLFFPISLFSKIPLRKYDLFLISTGGLAELIALKNYKPGKTCAYVHTILRAAYEEDVRWNLQYRYKDPFSKLAYLIAVHIYRFFERRAWKKIDVAIFNSELSLERAIKHNLVKEKKVYVVYPPVDVKKYEKAKIQKGDYFLYVARFGMAKRQDALLVAWKMFVKEHPNYGLVLAGSVENKSYFEKIKKIAAETKNVEIKTNIEDKELLKLYSNCLAVVFVPFMEDFGIVPFEAMVLGKPLMAVDKGGYVNLVKKYYKNIVWIKEGEELSLNIVKSLNKFLDKQLEAKKVKIPDLNAKRFVEKIENIIEK